MNAVLPGPTRGDWPHGPVEVVAGTEIRAHGKLNLLNTRFEGCHIANSSARDGRAFGVELIDCTIWACSLHDVHLEDCTVRNLKTSPGGGGRTTPLFIWGGTTRRVALTGTIGGIVWNPPKPDRPDATSAQAVDAVRRYYDTVDDWALDVSEARFRSIPSFRFGPPGRLVRRDPETQPLISRQAAARALALIGPEIGVWRVVLSNLVKAGWPDATVLMPALGGRKAAREDDLGGLDRLRKIGAFETDQ
jgi:hypothetical protein